MRHARDDYNGRIIDTAGIIPEDEPVFLLRGQDPVAADVVREWAKLYMNRVQMGYGGDPTMARLAMEHAEAMAAWPIKKQQADLPEGVQSPRLPGVPAPLPRKPPAGSQNGEPTPEEIYGPGPAPIGRIRTELGRVPNEDLEGFLFELNKGTPTTRMSEFSWYHGVQALFTEAQGTQMHPTTEAHVRSVINERLSNSRRPVPAGRR